MAWRSVNVTAFIKEYPITKGMITYAALWPTSNLCQQSIQGREKFNFAETARFAVFGTFAVAPTLYAWVKLIGHIIPGNTLKTAIKKAAIEQVVYAPFTITLFYTGMTLLENKSLEDAKREVIAKFIPTWRTGICIWPIAQTLNFAFVKESNRVPVTSVVSFFWTVFLSYMKQLESNQRNVKVINVT